MSKAPSMAALGSSAANLGNFSAASAAAGKAIQPFPLASLMQPNLAKIQAGGTAGSPMSWFEKLTSKMDKSKMRETGLGLMQQAMQQESTPPTPMQLPPFQPGAGGAGGGAHGGQVPALLQLLQQYGLNKVQ